MKRRWLALVLAAVLTVALIPGAQAAVVEHENADWAGNVATPGVNSDPVAQAEMLRQLGLFLGTDKGFELDKPLTRAQAAVMLTRLLGGEESAQALPAPQPFSDVPPWAEPYVGYLCMLGLTKGVGNGLYGSNRPITFEEYATMLARMIWGSDQETPWFAVSVEGEPELVGAEPFTRAIAVGLTVRVLCTPNATQGGKTGFQLLRQQGVFTTAELEEASWGVLTPKYETVDGVLTRSVAGVPVAQCPEEDYTVVEGSTALDQDWVLATRRKSDGLWVAQLNCRTLEVEAEIPAPNPDAIRLELVPELEAPDDGICVVEVLKNGSEIRYGKIYLWRDAGLEPMGTAEELWGADRLPPDGEALAPSPAEGSLTSEYGGEQYTFTATRLDDGSLRVSAEEFKSGASLGSYTIPPTDYDGDGVKELPSVQEMCPGVLAGTAGAYIVYDQKLVQMTDQPVLSAVMYDWRVGYALMTYTPGVSPVVQGQQTGDEIWIWYFDDGKECVIPADSTGITLLELWEDGRFRGISPSGVTITYFYTGTSILYVIGTADLTGLEANLAFWWEQSRLEGIGLGY